MALRCMMRSLLWVCVQQDAKAAATASIAREQAANGKRQSLLKQQFEERLSEHLTTHTKDMRDRDRDLETLREEVSVYVESVAIVAVVVDLYVHQIRGLTNQLSASNAKVMSLVDIEDQARTHAEQQKQLEVGFIIRIIV